MNCKSKKIADVTVAETDEILNYLSSVMLGNSRSSSIINIKESSCSYAKEIFVSPTEKERLKACELLSKFYDVASCSFSPPVIIDDISTAESFYSASTTACVDLDKQFSFSPEINDVLLYLSCVMRGKSSSSILVNVRDETGTYSKEMLKSPSEDERLKAVEMLAKFLDLFSSSNSSSNSSYGALPVILNSSANHNS